MTFSELAYVIEHSYTPVLNVERLYRTFDIKTWIKGPEHKPCLELHWADITKGQQFLFEPAGGPCLVSGVPHVGVSLKVAELSTEEFGPEFYILRNLPAGKPQLTAARPVFSHWEKDALHRATGNRTSDEQAQKDFDRSRHMICSTEGPITEMTSDQRKEWEEWFDSINKEQYLPSAPLPENQFFPLSKDDFQSHLKQFAKPNSTAKVPRRDSFRYVRRYRTCVPLRFIHHSPIVILHFLQSSTNFLKISIS